MAIIGIDIHGAPRFALVARGPDADRRGGVARHRHRRDLAEFLAEILADTLRGLQPHDQCIRCQHRRRTRLYPHDAGVQAGADLVLETHRRAGDRDQGQYQRNRDANDGMDLQQCGLDRTVHHRRKRIPVQKVA